MAGAAHKHVDQPREFKFSAENIKQIEKIVAKYPKGKQASAVMPLLDMAQVQCGGWIPEAAMEEIGRILDMPRIKVFEVATFYTMYNLKPVGKNHLQFCTTTPCWLRGSADVVKACEKHLGIKMGETTPDGLFTLSEVECLGACVNAAVIQNCGFDFYEDLTAENVIGVLDDLKAGKKPAHGSKCGRKNSGAADGATSLCGQAGKCGVKIAKREGDR